ncbi:cytochrome P450 [Mycena maculata]|uniref:Cytochrome P450 n=1 Tax=Mycena maculata TaxID=230809 RepID=A0AAD7K334_9AGAR|nr:cytochrome P450 [Mycena maculata]
MYGLYSRLTRSRLPLPPGPKKLPVVRNLFNLPSSFEWETSMECGRKYSQHLSRIDSPSLIRIFSIYLSSALQSFYLMSLEAAEALLDKRSSIYSDRPASAMLNLMGWDFNLGQCVPRVPSVKLTQPCLAVMKYDLDNQRNFHAHQGEHIGDYLAKDSTSQMPKASAPESSLQLMSSSADFSGALERSGSTSSSTSQFNPGRSTNRILVAYGIDVLPENDPYISLAEEAMRTTAEAAIPGRFLVDFLPVLRHIPDWVPGAGFKLKAKAGKKVAWALNDVPFAEASGTVPHSITAESLQILGESNNLYYDEKTVKVTAAKQSADGNRLDRWTGPLPDFKDEKALPYVGALVKEVLRWRNVTPIDEYRGYRIPAGSIVIGNVWAILHDEAMYPDPYSFKPERFLLDGKPNPDVRDPQAVFGFGRRICPGRHMANSSLWITIASILATFEITKAIEEDGEIIEPSYKFTPELVSVPLPFKCSIRPRSQDAVTLITATGDEKTLSE